MPEDRSGSLREAIAGLETRPFLQRTIEGKAVEAAGLAVLGIRGADMAGIALLEDGFIATGGASIELVDEIDSFQYASDQGPCLEAIRTNEVVGIDSTAFERRWPEFSRKSSAKGVGSVLSAPLVANGRVIGSLNLYAYRTMSFDEEDRQGIVRFAHAAAVALAEPLERSA
jgi:GAF domain-containing protein